MPAKQAVTKCVTNDNCVAFLVDEKLEVVLVAVARVAHGYRAVGVAGVAARQARARGHGELAAQGPAAAVVVSPLLEDHRVVRVAVVPANRSLHQELPRRASRQHIHLSTRVEAA